MNANSDRTGIGARPTRRACKRAICVHPGLSACICVSTSCCLGNGETNPEAHRDPRTKRPRPRAEYPTGELTNLGHDVTLFATGNRVLAAVWLRPRAAL